MILTDELERLRKANVELARFNKKLEDRLGLVNNEHYNISKSRKGIDKGKSMKGRNDNRPDFDGAALSFYSGFGRKGTTYKKEIVGEHKCDRSKLLFSMLILIVMSCPYGCQPNRRTTF